MSEDSTAAAEAPAPWRRLPPRLAEAVIRPAVAEVRERTIREVRRQHPPGPLLAEPLEANLQAGLTVALEQFADLVEGRRERPAADVFGALGRRQHQAGLPVDDLLAYYRIAAIVAWRVLSRAARRGVVDNATLSLLGDALFTYQHELAAAAADGYSTAQLEEEADARPPVNELVRRVVLGGGEREALGDLAAEVGWSLPEHLAALVTPADGAVAADAWLEPLPAAPVDGVVCALVPAASGGDAAAEVRRLAPADATVVVGPVVALADAGRSHRRALEVLDLARGGLLAAPGVIDADEHVVDLLVARQAPLLQELAQGLLGPLLALPASRQAPLLETLAAWLDAPGRPTAVAERLCVHAQTVRYRLGRLRGLLGDLVDDPARRLELALAVRTVTLLPPPAP